MKLKTIMMAAAVSLMLGACASTAKKSETCACGAHSGAVEKKDCASGECPMHKPAGCADCQEKDAKTGK